MTDNTYQPAKVWTWDKSAGGAFANINRPVSGPTHEKTLPVGKHPLQLYSLGTPNGQKVTIMLEELLALGVTGAEYDAWLIRIGDGDPILQRLCRSEPKLEDPRRCAIIRIIRRSACLNLVRSCFIWRRNLATSCRRIWQSVLKR
ncbi:glutathione S-transferase [Escherichia coli]|uniref:Glutathione S-transferase n=1 Tax=Escherichia coli TaxID=562 RepID=A0A376KL73_ECOLX|nr:glutathione S-transferase [Escherichia coli]